MTRTEDEACPNGANMTQMQTAKPRYPADIHLESNSLVEAWLEIRWRLPPNEPPQFAKDPAFAFALGPFFERVRDRFGFVEDTEASSAPFDLAYVVRHRFRHDEGSWPILQIGHGVASVNFTSPYSWDEFRALSLYLREHLIGAYEPHKLDIQSMTLRYRNAVPFMYASQDLTQFLKQNLNVELQLPESIPGFAGSKQFPTSANISLTFDLETPKGTGTLQIITGVSKAAGEVLVWHLELASADVDVPDVRDDRVFAGWLDQAHAAIHEWYFSLVDGPILQRFSQEE